MILRFAWVLLLGIFSFLYQVGVVDFEHAAIFLLAGIGISNVSLVTLVKEAE